MVADACQRRPGFGMGAAGDSNVVKSSKVVVVTGASGGVGRAVAEAFGGRGDAVGLLARGEEGLAGAADDVRAAGGRALAIPVDVADYAAVDAAGARVEEELGPI